MSKQNKCAWKTGTGQETWLCFGFSVVELLRYAIVFRPRATHLVIFFVVDKGRAVVKQRRNIPMVTLDRPLSPRRFTPSPIAGEALNLVTSCRYPKYSREPKKPS